MGVYEYVNKTTLAHLLDYLINNFIFVKITHGGLSDIGYWNGETYLLGKEYFMAIVMDVLSLSIIKLEISAIKLVTMKMNYTNS